MPVMADAALHEAGQAAAAPPKPEDEAGKVVCMIVVQCHLADGCWD
jgi:hypothetical protein